MVGCAGDGRGIAILAGFEPRFDERMLLGGALALVSALMFGLYSVADVRSGSVTGFSPTRVRSTACRTLGAARGRPQLYAAGYNHARCWRCSAGLIRWAWATHSTMLRCDGRATTVNLVATQEVTGEVLLGALLLSQVPQVNERWVRGWPCWELRWCCSSVYRDVPRNVS